MRHSEVTAAQAADRLAIRELFDAYAHHADRREAEAQKALFKPYTASSRRVVESAAVAEALPLEGIPASPGT